MEKPLVQGHLEFDNLHAPLPTTLLDLIFHLARDEHTAEQIEAAVLHLLNTNRVRLVGTFCASHQQATGACPAQPPSHAFGPRNCLVPPSR